MKKEEFPAFSEADREEQDSGKSQSEIEYKDESHSRDDEFERADRKFEERIQNLDACIFRLRNIAVRNYRGEIIPRGVESSLKVKNQVLENLSALERDMLENKIENAAFLVNVGRMARKAYEGYKLEGNGNDDLFEVAGAMLDILGRNQANLESMMDSENPERVINALRSFEVMLDCGNDSQRSLGGEAMLKYRDFMFEKSNEWGKYDAQDLYPKILKLIRIGTDEDIQKVSDWCAKELENGKLPADIIIPMLWSEYEQERSLAKSLLGDYFSSKGLDFEEFTQWWGLRSQFRHRDSQKVFEETCGSFISLEEKHPGIIKFISEKFDVKYLNRSREHTEFFTEEYNAFQEQGEEYIPFSETRRILAEYGLNADELLDSWSVGSGFDLLETTKKNMLRIREIEDIRPGSAKILKKEFGIRNFSRYSKEALLRQHDELENIDVPYIVALYPAEDWNGAFEHNNKLDKILEDLHGQFALRIVECSGKYELARSLVKLDERYGESHKISHMIINGHGEENRIVFGPGNKEKANLYIEDLAGRGAGRANKFFEAHPTIVLYSCFTGAKEGIGQKLSEILGAKVISPVTAPYGNNIQATFIHGRLVFLVHYSGSDSATYESGERIQSDYRDE